MSNAQAGYVSVDSALYYMDFDSRALTLLMEFPFNAYDLATNRKGGLYAKTYYNDEFLLLKINPFDSTYTTHEFPGHNMTFINDSVAYVDNSENLLLYNVNTGESSILEDFPKGDYQSMAYDSIANRLYVMASEQVFTDEIDFTSYKLLTFQNDQLIGETYSESLISQLCLDKEGNLYATKLGRLYLLNKVTGDFEEEIAEMEDYTERLGHHSITFTNRTYLPQQLFTSEDQLDLGTVPLNKRVERVFKVVSLTNQPWTFNGAEIAAEGLEINFNPPIGSEITDYLEISVQLEKESEGSSLDEISILWNDNQAFNIQIEAEVMEFQKAQQNEVYLSLRDGTILRLNDNYFYQGASATNFFFPNQITIDQSGYLHLAHYGKIYLLDWRTGTLLETHSDESRHFEKIFFGNTRTYLWENRRCDETRRILDAHTLETLYEFDEIYSNDICVTSAVLKPGTEEFYLAASWTKLYRLDLSAEDPKLEFLLEHESFGYLHFDENENLRAYGTSEEEYKIVQISSDFTTVQGLRESDYLKSLEITGLTALPLRELLVLDSGPKTLDEESRVRFYPNPFLDELKLDDPLNQIESIGLYSVSGRLIVNLPVNHHLTQTFRINEVLEAGVYLLKVGKKDGTNQVVKVIHNPR